VRVLHIPFTGEPEPMPVQEEGHAVGLEAVDEQDPDIDPEIATEVELQEETREAEEEHGPIEDAAQDPKQ
jgi:hypothetical protein